MRKNVLVAPIVTLLLVAAVILDIPGIRGPIAFAYLSFMPGYEILKALRLKAGGLLTTFLISVGLSLTVSMFLGLLINELYGVMGFSQPLSAIPLTAAVSSFTLVIHFAGFRRGLEVVPSSLGSLPQFSKGHLPLISVLVLLPLLGIFSAMYANIPAMLVLAVTISILCVLSVATEKIVPPKFYPYLIFSISLSLLLLNLFMSKYTIGDDATFEYYVFKVTQIRGTWGPLNPVTDASIAINYNSMLSITILPNFYSALMGLQTPIIFKLLYPFIFSLVPVTLYNICRSEVNRSVGLSATFFFIFTFSAFFGEMASVNRQIVGEFFMLLSVLLWLSKTVPLGEKRILLMVFGISMVVSHYSIVVLYLVFISVIVVLSSIKPKFDNVYNSFGVLSVFVTAFFWYAFSASPVLDSIVLTIKRVASQFFTFHLQGAGVAASIYILPNSFTVATWINLLLSSVTTLSLVLGIIIAILFSRKMGISDKYRSAIGFAAVIFAISYVFPAFAATLNFTRYYAITMLMLSPCFAIGILSVFKFVRNAARKGNRSQERDFFFVGKTGKMAMLLVAIILGAYFLSQSGFVNYVTDGAIHSYTFDYYRLKTSNNPQTQVAFHYAYIPVQDVFSSNWLSSFANRSSFVYSDTFSNYHVLASEGLVPGNLILDLTNDTKPDKGRFVYLDSLNVGKNLIPGPEGLFNTSAVSSSLNDCNLVYSNGKSEIRWGL